MGLIAGVVDLNGAPVDGGALDAMLTVQNKLDRHPPEYFRSESAVFAQCGTPSPHAQDPDLPAVVDARLDNREELRRALDWRGDAAAAATDRDLIVAAYHRWGAELCSHIRGAFALAIWDNVRKHLILARDPMGERALYWCRHRSRIGFATEAVQLRRVGLVDPELNQPRILAYLIGARPDPVSSYFENIRRLPPGSFLYVTPDKIDLRRYWNWDTGNRFAGTRDESALALADKIADAIQRRMPDSGGIGITLSGGLDSCSIATLAARELAHSGRSLGAFTWSSTRNEGIDERARSSLLVQNRPNIVEHQIAADDLWPLSRFPEAYSDANGPDTNSYPDLLLHTLETARQTNTGVMLNGLGGDPMIGWLLPELTLLLTGRWWVLMQRWRSTGLRRSQSARMAAMGIRGLPLPAFLTETARGLIQRKGLAVNPLPFGAMTSPQRVRRFLLEDTHNAIALERFDRLSRATGVRINAPWQDCDIADFVLSLPNCALDPNPPYKSLLRLAMRGHLHETLRNAATVKESHSRLHITGMLDKGKSVFEACLANSRLDQLGLLNASMARRMLSESSRRHDNLGPLWRLVTAECWLQRAMADSA